MKVLAWVLLLAFVGYNAYYIGRILVLLGARAAVRKRYFRLRAWRARRHERDDFGAYWRYKRETIEEILEEIEERVK